MKPLGWGARLRRWRFLQTFRGRLAALFVALEAGMLLLAGAGLYLALREAVVRELDAELEAQAEHLASELAGEPVGIWPAECAEFASHFLGAVRVVSPQRESICEVGWSWVAAPRALQLRLAADAFAFGRQFASTRPLLSRKSARLVAMPIEVRGRPVAVLVLARSLGDVAAVLRLVFWLGAVFGLVSIALTAFASYALAKRALAPLNEIRRTAGAVAAGDLSRRLTIKGEDREIRELVAVLNKMFGDLEAAFRAQKRFTADASHELRLPIAILKGEIEVALRHPRPPEEYRRVLRESLQTIARLERIVDDLLTLARADAHQLEFEQAPVDLTLLLEEEAQEHLPLFARKRIELEMDVEDGLEVLGDAHALARVFANLLHNAYKYAPEGSRVRLAARRTDGRIEVRVEDEGPGVPEHARERIFNRFYRVEDARGGKEGGAGLGLAIARHIVEAHGGRIRVEETRPGKGGASFVVELPAD